MGEEKSLGRGALIILAVGAALGIAHNLAGRVSQPARGIPWVASRPALPSLADLAASDPQDAPATSPDTSGRSPRAPSPGAPGPGSGPRPVTPGGPAALPPEARRSPGLSEAGSSAGAGTAPAQETPTIPELDHPVEVDLATAKRLFDARAALFLDARDPPEFQAGHIPGALRLTRNDALAEPEKLRDLPVHGRPVVAYCEGGECEASADLARTLVESGFKRVLVLPGGLPEWVAAGYPVEKGAKGP